MGDLHPLKNLKLKLEKDNPHPLDDHIIFDEVEHVYFVDGQKYPGSVSGLIHDYFPEFNAMETINRYYDSWRTKKEGKYYALINYLTGIIGFSEEMAKVEIARNWYGAGTKASTAGTATHLNIEMFLNEEHHDADNPEFQQFLEWKKTHPTWVPYRTEWSVFDPESLVCGQIDSVWKDENGLLHMVDWKRVIELKMSGFAGQTGYAPFDTLQNTNYSHYILQQNAYTKLLEKSYGVKISSMSLVQVHPEIEEFIEWALPRLDAELEQVFAERARGVLNGELKTMPKEVWVEASAEKKRKRSEQTSEEKERKEILIKHLTKVLELHKGP